MFRMGDASDYAWKNPSQPGLSFFLKWNIFNRLLKARYWKKYTGAFGKQGDVYFMANGEVWHGRVPNVHGPRDAPGDRS